MKRSNRLVILVGVLLAVLAFVGIVIVLNQEAPPDEREVQVDVLVATRDIELGETVTAADVTVQPVDPGDVVGDPIGDPSALPPRPVLYPIPEGSQVSADAFGGVNVPVCIECQLEPGEKAIAFQVDRVTGLDFLIQQGDHIDIVLAQTVQVLQPTIESTENPGQPPRFETIPGLENARTVKTILSDKRVLYVSARNQVVQPAATPSPGEEDQGEAPPEEQIESVIIVFAGTAQDAEVIKFAQNAEGDLGPLTAILRRILDTEEDVPNEETTGITIDILFEEYGIPIPDILVDLGPERRGGGGGGGQ